MSPGTSKLEKASAAAILEPTVGTDCRFAAAHGSHGEPANRTGNASVPLDFTIGGSRGHGKPFIIRSISRPATIRHHLAPPIVGSLARPARYPAIRMSPSPRS